MKFKAASLFLGISLVLAVASTPAHARSVTAFGSFHAQSATVLTDDPYTCITEDNGAAVNNCTYNVNLYFDLPIDTTTGTKTITVQDYWSGPGSFTSFNCDSYVYTGRSLRWHCRNSDHLQRNSEVPVHQSHSVFRRFHLSHLLGRATGRRRRHFEVEPLNRLRVGRRLSAQGRRDREIIARSLWCSSQKIKIRRQTRKPTCARRSAPLVPSRHAGSRSSIPRRSTSAPVPRVVPAPSRYPSSAR